MKRLWIFVLVLGACSSDPVVSGAPDVAIDMAADVGHVDTAIDIGNLEDVTDATTIDAMEVDVSIDVDEPDANLGVGFGALDGMCGVLDDELTDAMPHVLVNALDFGDDVYDDSDRALLTEGGRTILDEGNAGGSSLFSELFSYEVLARCEGAALLKTESNIVYDTEGSITDYLVQFDETKIGVSVTRVFSFPRDAAFNPENARGLVIRKLEDVLESSANVSAGDAWTKQVLHLMTDTDEGAAGLQTLIPNIDAAIRADTIIVITVTNGDDTPIYEE